MKISAKANVHVMYGGQERPAAVGIAPDVDPRSGAPRVIWGYVSDRYPDELTHMCYEYDGDAAELVEWARTNGHGWWYFDAGTTCTEIKISATELEVAFYRLRLLDRIGVQPEDTEPAR